MIKKDLFSIQFIDIVSVENSLPMTNYTVDEIDVLSDNYLECGGNINPIIVERTGLDEYRVIEGNLELYAAKKAREKDKFFEMIRAIILDKNNEKLVKQQVNLLGQKNVIAASAPLDSPTELEADPSVARLENSLLAKIDSLVQTREGLFNVKMLQRLEELENTVLGKLNELTTKLDTLPQQSALMPPRETERPNINKMSVSELKIEAKKRGLSGYSKLKKSELVALLS